VDELEPLASTAKEPIKGANGDPAEAANQLKALQEQGLRIVQARADSQKGYADWVAKAEAAAAAQAAKELKALQEQGRQVVQARADGRKAYADWVAKAEAAAAAAAADSQKAYAEWVAKDMAAAAAAAAEKVTALRAQGGRVVQERGERLTGCNDWTAAAKTPAAVAVTEELLTLRAQGQWVVLKRGERLAGCKNWVAAAEAAAAAAAAEKALTLRAQGQWAVHERGERQAGYMNWLAAAEAAAAVAAAEKVKTLRAQGGQTVQERWARQVDYKSWVAVAAAEKVAVLRLQGDQTVQERMARRSGCMDWIATREATARLNAVVEAAARLDANEVGPPIGSEAGQSERGEGGVSADKRSRKLRQLAYDKLPQAYDKLPQLRLAALRKEGEAVIARRAAVGEMLERHLAQRQTPKTVWPDDDDAWIGVLGAGLGGPIDEWGKKLPPTWTDLTQVPVRVPNKAAWKSLGKAKQIAILCRLSVVHLTLISCGVPCMLAGATGAATGLVAPLVWVVSLILWHLSHNMINDAQDLRRGLDENKNAFRLQYGTHPLAEGFVSKRSFGLTLGAISAASVAGSALLAGKLAPACAWAFPFGLAATLLYTPLAKPFGLGELLVLLVWGPAMFGGGWSAATGIPALQVARSVPVALGAFGMIMGKHIDKLDECRDEGVNTLPVLLGDKRARALAAAALVGQHVSLIALVAARKLPPGALLALAAAPFELRGALDVLRNGRPATAAGAKASYRGSMLPFVPARTWPLWHVAAAGWHAVTFGYWLMAGLGLSWVARAFCLAMA